MVVTTFDIGWSKTVTNCHFVHCVPSTNTVVVYKYSCVPSALVLLCRQYSSTHKRTNSFSANKHDTCLSWHQHHLTSGQGDIFVWWWLSQSVWLRTKVLQDFCASLCSPHTQVCEVTYWTFQNTKRFQKRTNNDKDTFVYVRCQIWLFKVWECKNQVILIRS